MNLLFCNLMLNTRGLFIDQFNTKLRWQHTTFLVNIFEIDINLLQIFINYQVLESFRIMGHSAVPFCFKVSVSLKLNSQKRPNVEQLVYVPNAFYIYSLLSLHKQYDAQTTDVLIRRIDADDFTLLRKSEHLLFWEEALIIRRRLC